VTNTQLTEQIQLKSSLGLSHLCFLAKNLYNQANFQFRQFFFHLNEIINYYDLDFILKDKDCYKALPAQTNQQVLRLVIRNWISYFKGAKAYKENSSNFLNKPRFPKYKSKNSECIAIFTNQNTRIKNGYIHFPKMCHLQPVKTRITKYQQVRIVPKANCYALEIVYNCQEIDLQLSRNNVLGIDLGLTNLATVANNIGLHPIVIKGGVAKSSNQFYNKINAKLQSMKDKQHYEFQTKKQQRLLRKRNNVIYDVFHKTSRWIINYCVKNDTGTIIIGYNKLWKQAIRLGKRTNQNFAQIPFSKLIAMIEYKAKLFGIQVIQHEESYTSKCSFLDNESIKKHNVYCGKRLRKIVIHGQKMKCNLFQCDNGKIINGDVNAAYNILKKAVPSAFAEELVGLVLSPLSVRLNGTFCGNK
jgi:putative transposase